MKRIILVSAINAGICNASTLHFFSIAEGFLKQGFEVEVFLPKPAQKIQYNVNPKIKIHHKIKIRKFGLPNFMVGLLQAPWIVSYVITNKIPIVYLRYFNCGSLLTLLLRKFSKAKIITEHNGWISDEMKTIGFPSWVATLARKFQVLDSNLAHSTRVVTSKLGKLFIEQGVDKNKVFCVGNGCNTHKVTPLKRNDCLKKLNLPLNNIYLGFIGTLHVWQGLQTAIKALPAIKKIYPKICLIIAGSGPQINHLKKLVNELYLNNSVVFLGHVQYSSINTVLGCFDIALAPFSNERNIRIGLSPLKIRDYAAAGLPVVASNIPGIKDYPSTTDWITTHSPDDKVSLANSVTELLKKPETLNKMKISARTFATKHFDWESISKDIISEATKQNHSKAHAIQN